MAPARVLAVGNCAADYGRIHAMLDEHFDVTVENATRVDEAEETLRAAKYDLVLVNRRIFADGSDGAELIRRIKADPALAGVPVMMISNFADAQERAVADGAAAGFGKAALDDPRTIERLARFLPRRR